MKKPNALIHERSPYLLQHAYNPVQWYPWSKEAFEQARKEEKPIFLSIGYSTCHWCHVMAEESFEDEEVAALLNAQFIPIKVDKEERPDVDSVYMQVCQAMTGSGGWPLTVLMTPDQLPFFAGTYFPKRSSGNQIGLIDLLEQVSLLWKTDRENLLRQGQTIQQTLSSHPSTQPYAALSKEILLHAAEELKGRFDSMYGGFGYAPKFPTPQHLFFLLQHSQAYGDKAALDMVTDTLRGMYCGGIFDHIGGGFCRYSTDETWLVPHFEKMLYDNALLASVLVRTYQVTRDPLFQYMAERTLDYLFREMRNADGGFYCAQDADSDHVEGKYYVFTPQEIQKVLGEDAGKAFCRTYHITPEGNFEHKSIPNLLGETPAIPDSETQQHLDALLDYRKSRTKLPLDDKILTAWNAMAISAFAAAGLVFDRPDYLEAAEQADSFIKRRLYDEDGRLLVRYRDLEAKGLGNLDDYAYFAQAQLDLYEATLVPHYLFSGMTLAKKMLLLFSDTQHGGFYLTPEDGESLLFRPKEQYDNALPSGSSVAFYVLCRLDAYDSKGDWRKALEQQAEALSPILEEMPSAVSYALLGVLHRLQPAQRLVCCLAKSQDKQAVLAYLSQRYLPRICVFLKRTADPLQLYWTLEYPEAKDRSQYYLCEGKTCLPPVSSLDELPL